MLPLKLPPISPNIRNGGSSRLEIWDPLRHKYVALTPEEWVRQHFTAMLCNVYKYPASLIANEVSLRLNETVKRCDTVIYSPSLRAVAIIEYKSPYVAITQRTLDQIQRYNLVLNVACLMVSNGLSTFCCRVGADGYGVEWLSDIPSYDQLLL